MWISMWMWTISIEEVRLLKLKGNILFCSYGCIFGKTDNYVLKKKEVLWSSYFTD